VFLRPLPGRPEPRADRQADLTLLRRLAAGPAVAFALLLAPRPAAADEPPADCNVIQLVTDASGSFPDRIRVELLAVGYRVEAVPDFEPGRPLGPCVRAVVRVEAGKRRAELWTSDRGRAQFRASIFAEAGAPSDEDTLAVRVAEDLRAYVLPPPPAPAEPAPPPRPPPAAPAAPAAPAFWLGAGFGLGLQPGGAGPGGFLLLRGRWMAHPRVGLGALGGLPVIAAEVSRAAGDATIRAFVAGPEAYLRLTAPASPVEAGVGAGVLLASISVSGTAQSPYVSSTDSTVTSLPFASAEVAPRIFDRVRLRAGALAGPSLPRTGVKFAGQRSAEWGSPLVLLSAGASFEF
jgi:hypothetical protein